MTVKELSQDQLNVLKLDYYFSDDYDEKITTSEGLPVLFAADIPNNIIFAVYDGVYFVEDDF